MDRGNPLNLTRRDWLKYTGLSSAALAVGGRAAWATCGPDQTPVEVHTVENTGCGLREDMPLSPLILNPFTEALPVPKALAPGWRRSDGTHDPNASDASYCRPYTNKPGGISVPRKDSGCQDSMGLVLAPIRADPICRGQRTNFGPARRASRARTIRIRSRTTSVSKLRRGG